MVADRLVARGHEVRWWVNGFEHPKKRWVVREAGEVEVGPRFKLQVLLGREYHRNISMGRYLSNRAVAAQFKAVAPHLPKPDLVVAALPCHRLAAEAVEFAAANGIPSAVDVRDLWPESFARALPHPLLQRFGRRVLWREFARARSALHEATAVTGSSGGFVEWAQSVGERRDTARDRPFFLACAARPPGPVEPPAPNTDSDPRPMTAAFLGSWGKSYELLVVLEAARRLQEQGRRDIRFVLAGDGLQGPEIRQRAASLDNVELPGWLDRWEIDRLLADADVGLTPCKSLVGTFPNKVFEYLSASLPVISSLEGEVATLIEENDLGFNYSTGDVDGLTRALNALADDPDRRRSMAANALSFFEVNGDAAVVYEHYSDWLEEMVTDAQASAKRGAQR